MINEIILPSPKDEKKIIKKVKEMYLEWLDNGNHSELESYREYGRDYFFVKFRNTSRKELIELYETIGEWAENEYTGDYKPFIGPDDYDNVIYELINDFAYSKILELNKLTRDDLWENDEIQNVIIEYIYEFQGRINELKISDILK